MIFMHNETGDLYELLILSLDDSNNENFIQTGKRAFRMGEFTLYGQYKGPVGQLSCSDFCEQFTFVGII